MPGTHYRLGSLALLFLSVSSCGSNLDPTIADDSNLVTKMSFGDTPPAPLSVGETTKLTAYFFVSSGSLRSAPEVTYVSSNPAVATVVAKGASYDGIVTAVSPGTTTITATCCSRISATVVVTVRQAWAFDSTSGASTGSWQDAKGSASATLRFVPRDTVYEGENYNLIYKFIGTVMIIDGFSGRPSASLSIGFANLGLPAYSYDSPKQLGLMVPGTPLKDSISLSVTWPTIPAGASVVGVEVRGSIPTGAPPNSALVMRAYYHKVRN